jgi:hypothetical protein
MLLTAIHGRSKNDRRAGKGATVSLGRKRPGGGQESPFQVRFYMQVSGQADRTKFNVVI